MAGQPAKAARLTALGVAGIAATMWWMMDMDCNAAKTKPTDQKQKAK